jgi:exopolysaccharide production protein ExoY
METLERSPGYNRYKRFYPLKRLFDVVFAALCLAVFILPCAFIALLVRFESGRSFFIQKRVGRNGQDFNMYKFASMRPNASDELLRHLETNPRDAKEWAWSHKLKLDPRVTCVGRTLRRWSLDELPQLLNIFKGEMTFVGPRPLVQEEVVRYGERITDFYACVPGLTGLWQASGRSALSFEQQAEMNSAYVRNWSISLEFSILLRTVPQVFKGSGAY